MAINDQNNEKARINLEYKSKIQGGRSVKLPYRMMVLVTLAPTTPRNKRPLVIAVPGKSTSRHSTKSCGNRPFARTDGREQARGE